jgi:hypothetical protein
MGLRRVKCVLSGRKSKSPLFFAKNAEEGWGTPYYHTSDPDFLAALSRHTFHPRLRTYLGIGSNRKGMNHETRSN